MERVKERHAYEFPPDGLPSRTVGTKTEPTGPYLGFNILLCQLAPRPMNVSMCGLLTPGKRQVLNGQCRPFTSTRKFLESYTTSENLHLLRFHRKSLWTKITQEVMHGPVGCSQSCQLPSNSVCRWGTVFACVSSRMCVRVHMLMARVLFNSSPLYLLRQALWLNPDFTNSADH